LRRSHFAERIKYNIKLYYNGAHDREHDVMMPQQREFVSTHP